MTRQSEGPEVTTIEFAYDHATPELPLVAQVQDAGVSRTRPGIGQCHGNAALGGEDGLGGVV